jgi:hypothetical protein
VEVVFEPTHIQEVNAKFKAAGYHIDDGTQVIAVNEDGSLLIWGGLNSVYHLEKGERIQSAFANLAFNDILHLTRRFKIKNKKPEIDAMMAQMKEAYGDKK